MNTLPDPKFSDFVRRVGRSEALRHKCRKWSGNDKSQRSHHSAIPFTETPMYVCLTWKAGPGMPGKPVGCFQLDLPQLLKGGHIRKESPETVRVRFYHATDGLIYIQSKNKGPRIAVGRPGDDEGPNNRAADEKPAHAAPHVEIPDTQASSDTPASQVEEPRGWIASLWDLIRRIMR